MHQSFLLALTAASAVFAAPAPTIPAADGFKVPMTSRRNHEARADGSADLTAYLGELQRTLHKYHSSVTLPASLGGPNRRLKRANNEALADQVEDGEDELYYGSGIVGATGPQTFKFDFDTGSSDLFVPGPSCGTAQGCPGTTKYDQGGVDEHNTTTVVYGSGTVTGENYYDDVTIAGLTANHQNVVSLSTAQGFANSDADSLLGMAFQSIANSKQPPYFQTLIAQKKVTTQEFSFYLGRAQSNTQGASELTLGGRDTSKFTGAITQVPVTSQTYWQVALDQLTVNGKAVALTKGQAAIDTGTTIILAPTAAAASLFSQIPGSFPIPLLSGSPAITIFGYPCQYNGTVAIQFAGKQFKINKLDFNFGQITEDEVKALGLDSTAVGKGFQQTGAGGVCLAAVAGADIDPTENLYVVGDSFLKNWYSIFSFNNYNGQPSVNFAAAAVNNG